MMFPVAVPVVGFQQTMYSVDEEMVPGTVEVCVLIFSLGILPLPVNVNFNTADGTATSETLTNDTQINNLATLLHRWG